MTTSAEEATLLSSDDFHYLKEGKHLRLYWKLGSHLGTVDSRPGTFFSVWAPNAERVSIIGNFNEWSKETHLMTQRGDSGIWEAFVEDIGRGTVYKYHVVSRHSGHRADKSDPFAFHTEVPPATASIVWDLEYEWNDRDWLKDRAHRQDLAAPISIYEVHLGSWMRVPEENNRFLTYVELADRLAEYVSRLGFTHVEFLPVMEHPFYGSWGYQTTGYFAPTSRYGTPQDFMYLIDVLHQHDIGVILDWVPSHFPSDEHGLAFFDGTHLYEHADPRRGIHPEWNTHLFDYARPEVQSFLLSSAFFWLDVYHVDALRVDAVASMLYLDYGRKPGEWVPNEHGGRENLDAVAFLRRFNEEVYRWYPGVQTIAEESTAWPAVSRPTYVGGLGFGYKWDMGWMHDTLKYMSQDPFYRRYHHDKLTFRMMYAFQENYILPLSHDEVVHGTGSLLSKMPGDEWRRHANLRTLFGYMYGLGAKKLLFMGGEFGQWREWDHDGSLDWHLLEFPSHQQLQDWVRDLNQVYRREPALYEIDFEPSGFEWVDCCDTESSTISFLRHARTNQDLILVVCNFTPLPRFNYQLGVPRGGFWREILNSDAHYYGGSGHGNLGGVEAAPIYSHNRPHTLNLTVPPLAVIMLKSEA
ncbi:MAG TPA: 1,4-alpha-glucan branching protein GlgB [Acidobacteriota bacterium]|nr:1,4-alpha-glucan branching protein GlgB [Acidobacteriota bacterium]